MAATWSVSPNVERYDDAVDWFSKRTVITAADARALDDRLKVEAFWVGGGLQLTQVQRVFDAMTEAIERGDTLEDFKKAVKADLRNPAHVETVFRNATQRAYNAGRYVQMHEESTLRFRPYGLVDAILDGRTTPYCRDVDGTLLPLDDPWWDTHWFPAHHRCRTSVRNLRRSEAEKRGAKPPPPGLDPPGGWGHAPTTDSGWKPDPAKHDRQLLLDFEGKAAVGTKKRKPRTKVEHTAAHWEPGYRKTYGDAAPSLAHGKAALERGLDLTAKDVRTELGKLDTPGARTMLEALEDADAARTLREQAGELDPLRKAAAAVAGHLKALPKRARVKHRGLARDPIGKRALALVSQVTGPGVSHPEDWTFRHIRGRASASASAKQIRYSSRIGALEHEWGHALEALNPVLLGRAIAFLKARTAGEKLKNYGANGLCREDRFADYYVGRHYEIGGKVHATEVTSMALEALVAGTAQWGTLQELVQKDPEHLLFLLGQLAGP